MDLAAVLLFLIPAQTILAQWLVALGLGEWWPLGDGRWGVEGGRPEAVVWRVLATMGANLLAIAFMVWLARKRDGNSGSQGIWPFWRDAGPQGRTHGWADLGMALGSLALTLWFLVLCNFANQKLVVWLGGETETHRVLRDLQALPDPFPVFIVGLAVTAGAAFSEELLFRGFLYQVLKRPLGALTSALLTAFLFAFLHYLWSNMLYLFFMSLILSWLYERTGRLLAPILYHFFNNLLVFLIAFLG